MPPKASSQTSKTTPRAVILLMLLALTVGGGGAWFLAANGRSQEKLQLGETSATATKGPVSSNGTINVVEAVESDLPQFVTVTGSLAADEDSAVAARAGGVVQEVLVERGTTVTKGQVLVELDPVTARNALAEGEAGVQELHARLGLAEGSDEFKVDEQPEVLSAKSSFDLAKTNFERDRQLLKTNVVSMADLDRSQTTYNESLQRYQLVRNQVAQLYASYRTAKTRLTALRQHLTDMTIKAPFNGVVQERMVSPGEFAAPGSPVVTLVRLDPVRLVLTVPEQTVRLAQPGAKVAFTVTPYPERSFEATVRYIAPKLEAVSRSLTVEALVDNPDGVLRPGYFATARLPEARSGKAVSVPTTAVSRNGEFSRVFVVDADGVAREHVVTLAETNGEQAFITNGLKAGDKVAANALEVSEGMKVR